MRPKITFRDGRGKGMFRGVHRFEDAELDPDLARSLAMWRMKYRRFLDRSITPHNQDIKATLRKLTAMREGAPLERAVKALDPATKAHLRRAAGAIYTARPVKPAKAPAGVVALRPLDVEHGRLETRSDLQELAVRALEDYPADKGGAPTISGLDHLFATALVLQWNRLNPAELARLSKTWSPFMDFAVDMFRRVGRQLSDDSLPRILAPAIKEARSRR